MELKKVSRVAIKTLITVSGLVGFTWWIVILSKDPMCELPTTAVQAMVLPITLCVWGLLVFLICVDWN